MRKDTPAALQGVTSPHVEQGAGLGFSSLLNALRPPPSHFPFLSPTLLASYFSLLSLWFVTLPVLSVCLPDSVAFVSHVHEGGNKSVFPNKLQGKSRL